MSEVRDLFERGAGLIGGRIRHHKYIHRDVDNPGKVCEACVNGAIALGYLGERGALAIDARFQAWEQRIPYVSLLKEAVPLLALDVGPITCPMCGEKFAQVTVIRLIDHLFELDDVPPLAVVAYVEALTADLTLTPVTQAVTQEA